MDTITIIHNPRCSKSRQALQIIESHSQNVKIIDYLNGELTRQLLEEIIEKLNIHPKEILRTQEDEYKTLHIDFNNPDEVMLTILKYPKILERPIVIQGNRAVIGRPPENVLSLF